MKKRRLFLHLSVVASALILGACGGADTGAVSAERLPLTVSLSRSGGGGDVGTNPVGQIVSAAIEQRFT